MSITPIIQFGTSRFLQAHADLFLSEALERGEAIGPVTVVQSSGDAGRNHRLGALADPAGFPVRIKGLEQGRIIEREVRVTSVRRALDTARDWHDLCRIASWEARIILSNTSEKGWVAQGADRGRIFDQAMSYPAKLTHLLAARYAAGGAPIQIMPTELIARNGEVLRKRVLELAAALSADLADWIRKQVTFVNSLVDRIVSEPLEPAGAIAEPYALWAIEDCAGLIAPCRHPGVQIVDDLGPIERRKLYILNLGHSWLVSRWMGDRKAIFVRDLLADPACHGQLEDLYATEVLPVFEAAGDTTARAYIVTTLDRFANPFLDHRLSDIEQNHAVKLQNRIGAFLAWADELGVIGERRKLREALG